MDTEKRTNDMNMDMTGRMPRAKKMRRRILALTCALAIALLQCAVIMTVGTEEAHGADSVNIQVTYKDGKDAKKSDKSVSNNKTINCKYTVTEEDVEVTKTLVLKGASVGSIISGIGNPSSVTLGGKEITGSYSDWILIDSVSGDIPDGMTEDDFINRAAKEYSSLQDIQKIKDQDSSTNVSVVSGNNAITITVSGVPKTPKVGQTYKLTADYDADSFYKDNYTGSETSWTWTSNNPSAATVDNNGNVKIISTKSASITASIYGKSESKSITGKSEPTKKKISDAKITLSKYSYTYDGKEKKPSVTVMMGKKKLKQGTDYTVSYKDNKSAGTARVTIKGKGKYEGSVTQTFTISKSSNNNNNNTRNTSKYRTFATRSPGASTATTRTGTTTVPTVTYTPDRTITVKEVYLGQEIQEEEQQNPYEEMYEDPYATDESGTTNEWEDMDTSVDFGPAASSAAAAAAVCGAGAIGRIRRFRVDTKTVVSAASQAGNQTTAQAGPETEKKSRLSRFKKS